MWGYRAALPVKGQASLPVFKTPHLVLLLPIKLLDWGKNHQSFQGAAFAILIAGFLYFHSLPVFLQNLTFMTTCQPVWGIRSISACSWVLAESLNQSQFSRVTFLCLPRSSWVLALCWPESSPAFPHWKGCSWSIKQCQCSQQPSSMSTKQFSKTEPRWPNSFLRVSSLIICSTYLSQVSWLPLLRLLPSFTKSFYILKFLSPLIRFPTESY